MSHQISQITKILLFINKFYVIFNKNIVSEVLLCSMKQDFQAGSFTYLDPTPCLYIFWLP